MADEQQKEVLQALERLAKWNEELAQAIRVLADGLVPVLRSASPAVESKGQTPIIGVPLANTLEARRLEIEAAVEMITDIRKRLAI